MFSASTRDFHFFDLKNRIPLALEKKGGKISDVLPSFQKPDYDPAYKFYVISCFFVDYPWGCMTKSPDCDCRDPLRSIHKGCMNCLQRFVSKILETKDENLSNNAKTLSVSLNLITDNWRLASTKYSTTLLHFACLTGQVECVRYLLSLDRLSLKNDQSQLNALQFFCNVKASSNDVFQLLLQDHRFHQSDSSYVRKIAQDYAVSAVDGNQNFCEEVFWRIFAMARDYQRDMAIYVFIDQFLFFTSKRKSYFWMFNILKIIFSNEGAIAMCACFNWCATITRHPREPELEQAKLVIKLASRYFSDVSEGTIKKEMKDLYDRYKYKFVPFHGNEEKYEIFVNWVLGVIANK